MPVSSLTGEGLPELKRSLLRLALEEESSGREARGARLPIDRAFSIVGFGPVVTGSLVSGTISRDQRLELLPARRSVRVRRLEVHGSETEEARAGERVSANLAGVELEEVRRGVVLAAPGAFATSALLTARLELLSGAPPVKSGDRLSFHHYSSESRALVRVLDGRVLRGGETGRVQLRLSQPVAAIPGDRFVVRRLSPVETIGGGAILDPLWPPLRRATPEILGELDRLDGSLSEKLLAWVEQAREAGADEETLAARAGVGREEVRAAMADPIARGRAHALRRSPERYVGEDALARLAVRARSEIERGLRETSGSVGVSRGTLLARLLPSADPRWAEAVEKALVARGAYVLAGEEARIPGEKSWRAPSATSPRASPRPFAAGDSIPPPSWTWRRKSATNRRSSKASRPISSSRARFCGCPAAGSSRENPSKK